MQAVMFDCDSVLVDVRAVAGSGVVRLVRL